MIGWYFRRNIIYNIIQWLQSFHEYLSNNYEQLWYFFALTPFSNLGIHIDFLQPPLTLIGQGFWMLLECGGGWISPHLLDHPKTLWKTKKILFDFLKVHNELGKVTKFWTSKPLFSRRNGRLKKVRADSAPPPP